MTATGASAPRPEPAAANQPQGESTAPASTAEPATRAAAPATRTPRNAAGDTASGPDRGGEDFAALLVPAAETATPTVAAAHALPATTPAAASTAPEAPAATPDQWLAMLAGALAMPVAVTAPETPVAPPAGIPTPTSATTNVLPLPTTAPLATPSAALATTPATTLPALGIALAEAMPAADPASSSAEAKPAFETVLNGLAAPSAPTTGLPVREIAPPPPPLQMPAESANGFDDGIGTHIAWMAGQRLGEARISVSPEHLGPIEVTLKLDDARVDAHFHSTHVEVRAALEASVPRLREMLAQHGLQLGQADVGHRQHASQPQPQSGRSESSDAAGAAGTAPQAAIARRRGLLDEYA